MTKSITLSVTETRQVCPTLMRDAFPHLIWPTEIGVFEPIVQAEIVQLETDTGPKCGILVLRLYILPEHDGSQLVLCQHFSERCGPVMGVTARLWRVDESLPANEQRLARNALLRMVKIWRADRKK